MPANDPLARMREAVQRQAAAMPTRRRLTVVDTEEQKAPAPQDSAEHATDMKTNPVYQIMTDTKTSTQEKIDLVTDYILTKDEDYETARKHFAQFEAYFTNSQEEYMLLDEQGIERLIQDVENDVKPKIELIIRHLAEVQKDSEDLDKMLDVMEKAKIDGKTIEELKAAVELNDKIVAEIDALNKELEQLGLDKTAGESRLGIANADKKASETGFANWFKRLAGPDKEIKKRLMEITATLADINENVAQTTKTRDEKVKARREDLETGSLAFLRGIDATEDSFSDRIASTGRHSLELIRSDVSSVKNILMRISQRKVESAKMTADVASAQVRNSILKGVIHKASDESSKQSGVIKERLDAKNVEINAATDDVERSRLEADAAKTNALYTNAFRYVEALKSKVSVFESVAANSTKSEHSTRRYADFLLSTEREMQRLYSETLPETLQEMRMGLETDTALQLHHMGSSIAASTEVTRRLAKRNWARLVKTSGDIQTDELAQLDQLHGAVVEAQESLLKAADTTVKFGIERGKRTDKVKEATGVLKGMLREFDVLSANAADMHVDEADQVETVSVGAEPEHPAKPAMPKVPGTEASLK